MKRAILWTKLATLAHVEEGELKDIEWKSNSSYKVFLFVDWWTMSSVADPHSENVDPDHGLEKNIEI